MGVLAETWTRDLRDTKHDWCLPDREIWKIYVMWRSERDSVNNVRINEADNAVVWLRHECYSWSVLAQPVWRLAMGWTVRGSDPVGWATFYAALQTCPRTHWAFCKMSKKVKQSHYRPGHAQRVPGSYQISWQRHWMVLGCQPYASAAFTPRKYSWYSFLLEGKMSIGSFSRG